MSLNKDYIVNIDSGEYAVTVTDEGEYIVNVGQFISGVGYSNTGTGTAILDDTSAANDIQFKTLVAETETNKANIEIGLAVGGQSVKIGTTQDITARNLFASNSIQASTGSLTVQDGTFTTLDVNSTTTGTLVLTSGMSGAGDIAITGNVSGRNMTFTGTFTANDLNDLVTVDGKAGQNITITTDTGRYVHMDTADLYVGPLSGAVKIDENSITTTSGTLTVTGNLTGDVTGTVSDVSNHDTDDISEGSSNLYFTNERVDDRVNALLTAGSNITLTYDDTANTLTIAGQVEDDLSNNTTDDLAEGSTNLYYTDARVETALTSVSGHIIPSANVTYDLGSTTNAWRDIYVGPGSLYVDGQKIVSSDEGTIDITTDSGQNLNIQSGNDLTLLSADANATLSMQGADIHLGTSGNDATIDLKGNVELLGTTISIQDTELTNGLINATGTNQNLEIRTNGTGYLHANIGGSAYFGSFSSAVQLDGANKRIQAVGGDLGLNSNTDITGTLDVSGATTISGNTKVEDAEFTVEGDASTKKTLIGDQLIAASYDMHGIRVSADDTCWAGISLEEYVGGADKPVASGFTNPTFGTEIIGGTPTAKAAVASGKRLFVLQSLAANATDGSLPSTANFRIKAETTEAQTSTNRGTKVSFESTANGNSATTETIKLQGDTVTINTGGDGKITSGGTLILDDDVQVNSTLNVQGTSDFDDDVNMDGNLQVDGTLDVDGNATFDGSVTLGNANTDTITSTGKFVASNGIVLTSMNTSTANYLAGVLGIIDEGAIAYITDGDSGSKCIAVYDGSNWKRISFGANISST